VADYFCHQDTKAQSYTKEYKLNLRYLLKTDNFFRQRFNYDQGTLFSNTEIQYDKNKSFLKAELKQKYLRQ
jgi:hypothetical protein